MRCLQVLSLRQVEKRDGVSREVAQMLGGSEKLSLLLENHRALIIFFLLSLMMLALTSSLSS